MKEIALNKQSEVTIDEKVPLYSGFNQLYQYNFRFKRHDGSWSRIVEREVFSRRNAVAVLACDFRQNNLVLIEQFRIGAFSAGYKVKQLEPIAGILDAGDSDEETARKEVKEEAGADIGLLLPMLKYLVSPGCVSEQVTCFLGTIDTKNIEGIFGVESEDEDIKPHVLSFEDAFAMLGRNEFNYALTIICLQWLKLHLPSARRYFDSHSR